MHTVNETILAKRRTIFNLYKHVDIEQFPDSLFNLEIDEEKHKTYRRMLSNREIELDSFDIVEKRSTIDGYGVEKLECVIFRKTSKVIDIQKLADIVELFFNILGVATFSKGLITKEEFEELENSKQFDRYWEFPKPSIGSFFSLMININEQDGLTIRILI